MNEEYREDTALPATIKDQDQVPPEVLARRILDSNPANLQDINDDLIAEKLLTFFLRPKDGMEKMSIFDPNSGETVETMRPFSRPLPLLSEFSRLIGLTESELNSLGRKYPATVGRALSIARDVQQEYVTHRGLSGDYHPRYAEFVSINLTNMRKDGADHEDVAARREELSSILDEIEEGQKKLFVPPLSVTDAPRTFLS